MKYNKFAISIFLGTTVLSTQTFGASIILGPGTVISAPNIELSAPNINIDPSVQIESDNLTINGENYSSSEAYKENVELRNLEDTIESQYSLSESDKKAWLQYTDKILAANPELQKLSNELEQISSNTNLSKEEQNNKSKPIIQQIFANNSYSQVRIQPANQENLKLTLKTIEHARELSEDNQLIAPFVKDELQELQNHIEAYLITDFTNKTVSEIPEVQKSDSYITESLIDSSMITRGIIDSRIGNFTGISSGEGIANTYGVWAKGMFSKGSQKSFKNNSGYKFDQKGFTIGADIGDESMFGVAYSYLKGNVKNKDNKSNKSDADTHAISLYGQFSITNEIFASGQTQFGFSQINKKRATGDLANNVATAKPKAKAMAGKIEIGYIFSDDQAIHIMPTLGVSYTNAQVNGYTEKGDGLNRTVGKRTSNRTSAIANISAKYIAKTGNMQIIPELHAGIDYAVSSKNTGTKVKIIDGIEPIVTPSEKLTKAFYIVGFGLQGIKSDKYEISAGYDMGFAKKFQSHTGTLKLRINI